jgi:hypothetical protein
MTKRRMKPKRAATIARMESVKRLLKTCPNCDAVGAGHFVPPSLGEPGFFICGPRTDSERGTPMGDQSEYVADLFDPEDGTCDCLFPALGHLPTCHRAQYNERDES